MQTNIGYAQILGILAVNKKYITRDVFFYVQWLEEDNRNQSRQLKKAVPFNVLKYEKVRDDRGIESNIWMRTIISAAELNRPAFVVPRTVLHAGN